MKERLKWGILSTGNIAKTLAKASRLHKGVVMFPTQHDVHQGNLAWCLEVLDALLWCDNRVLLVTKADPACIEAILDRYGHGVGPVLRLEIRVTLGALDDAVLGFWEPGAPSAAARIEALRMAAKYFRASGSAEPLLAPWEARRLYDAIAPWAETIWVGCLNHGRKRTAWLAGTALEAEAAERLRDIEAWQTPLAIREVAAALAGCPKVRWKDSYRKILEGSAK